MGRRFRSRKRQTPRPHRPPGKQHPPLHVRFPLRTPQDPRPLHHPRRPGTRRLPRGRPPHQPHRRSALEFHQDLRIPARLSGRPRRPHHLLHGRLLYLPQIRQSEKHELMRILHLDAGKEMRGGQWQGLPPIASLAPAGVESTLLARYRSPLFIAARKQGWRVHPLGIVRLLSNLRSHDLIHAHDSRGHSLGALVRSRPLIVSRRVAFPVGSPWKYARARRYLAVSELVSHVLISGGVPAEKIAVVYDGVPILEVAHGHEILGLEKDTALLAHMGLKLVTNLEAQLPDAKMLEIGRAHV